MEKPATRDRCTGNLRLYFDVFLIRSGATSDRCYLVPSVKCHGSAIVP